MDHSDPTERVLNLRVTHRRATVPVLEAVEFEDPASAMEEMGAFKTVSECLILQTCNRVEVFIVAADSLASARADVEKSWFATPKRRKASEEVLEASEGTRAVEHALRVAAGLESMVIGEDEILGQVKAAFEEGRSVGSTGPVLERIFESAVRLGKTVRSRTAIDRGAVSVGSAGVELLHQSLGDFRRKKVLVIGAGEAGETVARALASRRSGVMFVANRTFQKAVALARDLGGTALPFGSLERSLLEVDAAVVATSAPHSILSYQMMSRVMKARRGSPLVVVDLAEPRNVDLTVARLWGLTLCNLDDLRDIARSGIEKRSREIRKAEKLVEQSLGQTLTALRQDRVEPLVASLFREAEAIRSRETQKAIAKMSEAPGTRDSHSSEVLEDLSKVLVKRVLSGPVELMRSSAAGGDFDTLDAAEKLFGMTNGHHRNGSRSLSTGSCSLADPPGAQA